MAIRKIDPDVAYGVGDALIQLAPLPIVARRDPTSADIAQLATTWVNQSTGTAWILASVSGNSANWVTSPVTGGAGVFTSLETTAGGLTVDLGAGGINVGAGNFTVDNAGDVSVLGNLAVGGTITFTGTLDLTSAAEIIISSTHNAAPSVFLQANGGASEQVLIESVQGTSSAAVQLTSVLGGVAVSGGLNNANAIALTATNAAGGITLDAGTAGIILAATNGAVAVTSGTGAINIGADAAAHTITLGNSTGATSLVLNAGTGALNIGTNAIAHTVTIGNNTGASVVAINAGTGAAGAINIGTTANDVPITLGNSTGATAILLNAGTSGVGVGTNAIAHTVTLGNNTGASSVVANVGTGAASFGANATDHSTNIGSATGVSATTVQGGTAGITLTAPFVALPGPVYIYTGAGAPSNGAALHVGDMYINTTAATAATRLYIATGVGAWTNVTCAA